MMKTLKASEQPSARTRVSVTYRSRKLANGCEAVDARWRHQGRAWSRSFEDRDMAERWGVILERVGHETALTILDKPQELQKPTLDAAAAQYIESRTALGESTRHRYERYMSNSISPAFGMLPIDVVHRTDVVEWVKYQQETDRDGRRLFARKTIKNKLMFLASVFEYARDEQLIGVNPARKVEIAETIDKEMIFLSIGEFRVLLSFIPDRYKALVFFLAFTGLRWSEATALVGGDIDMGKRHITVNKAWKWTPTGYVIGTPKTRRSKRVIPFDMELARYLAPLVGSAGQHGFVFTNSKGGPVRVTTFWARAWAPARRLANGQPAMEYKRGPYANGPWNVLPSLTPILKWPRIHDLRHTHASWLIEKGVAYELVQSRLGHESITTTVDRYGHIDPRRVKETLRATTLLSEELHAQYPDDYDDD